MVKKISFLGCSIIFHLGLLLFIKITLPYKYQPAMRAIPLIFLSKPKKIISLQTPGNLQHSATNLKSSSFQTDKSSFESKNNILENPQPFQSNIYPTYPEIAQKKGIEADFNVSLTVNAEGSVSAVMINEHPYLLMFKNAIEKALYTWKFNKVNNYQERYFNQLIVFRLS